MPPDEPDEPLEPPPSSTHVSWFGFDAWVPVGHASHVRSAELDPAWLTREPASHTVHGLQAAAFVPALKVALGHAAQTRSAVPEGAPAT